MSEELNPAWQYVNRPKLVGNDRNDREPDKRLIEPIIVDAPSTYDRIQGIKQAIIDAFYHPDIQSSRVIKLRPYEK